MMGGEKAEKRQEIPMFSMRFSRLHRIGANFCLLPIQLQI